MWPLLPPFYGSKHSLRRVEFRKKAPSIILFQLELGLCVYIYPSPAALALAKVVEREEKRGEEEYRNLSIRAQHTPLFSQFGLQKFSQVGTRKHGWVQRRYRSPGVPWRGRWGVVRDIVLHLRRLGRRGPVLRWRGRRSSGAPVHAAGGFPGAAAGPEIELR